MTMNSRTVSPEEAAAVAENIELKARIVELETIIADLTQDSAPETEDGN
jgi:cell division protein FtsB